MKRWGRGGGSEGREGTGSEQGSEGRGEGIGEGRGSSSTPDQKYDFLGVQIVGKWILMSSVFLGVL